jgi:hypothetical protein
MRPLILLLLMVVGLVLPLQPPTTTAQRGLLPDREVWVFYLAFWNEASWDLRPNVMTDYPLERYATTDATAIRRQIGQAQDAGIDAFVVGWFGLNDQGMTTPSIETMLAEAEQMGFKIGVAVDIFNPQFLRNKAEMIDSLAWLMRLTNHPAYLTFDGKPIIHFAFQELSNFSNTDWRDIRNQVDPNRQTIWIAEGLNGCCIHGGVFDGMYAFNMAWAGSPASAARQQMTRMRNAGGSIYIPTVHPGWDESRIAAVDNRPNPTSTKNRAEGQFLVNSWNGAAAVEPNAIMIVSWNEFMEGSHIEPSVKYGTQALDILRQLIYEWKSSPRFVEVAPPPPAFQNSEYAAETYLLTPVDYVRVRRGPGTDYEQIGLIEPGERFPTLAEIDGWYVVNFDGQPGYISGEFVVFVEEMVIDVGPPPANTVSTDITSGPPPDISLVYSQTEFMVMNVSGEVLDLSSISLTTSGGELPLVSWDNGTLASPLASFPVDGCLHIWQGTGTPTKANLCNTLEGWIALKKDAPLFWHDEFVVNQNGTPIVTCTYETRGCDVVLNE